MFPMIARPALGALMVALLAVAPLALADPDPGNATPQAVVSTAQSCAGVDPGPPPALVGSCWNAAVAFGAEVILPTELAGVMLTCYDVDYGPPPNVVWGPCAAAALNLTGLPP